MKKTFFTLLFMSVIPAMFMLAVHVGQPGVYAAELYSFEDEQKGSTCGDDRAHYLYTQTNVYRKGKLFAVISMPTSSMIDTDTNVQVSSNLGRYKSTIKICNNYTLDGYDQWHVSCKLIRGFFECDSKEECINIAKEQCVP